MSVARLETTTICGKTLSGIGLLWRRQRTTLASVKFNERNTAECRNHKETTMKGLINKRDARKKPARTMKEKKAAKNAKKAALKYSLYSSTT